MSILKSFATAYLSEASGVGLMLVSAGWALLGLSDPAWWFVAPLLAGAWGVYGWIFFGKRAGIAAALGFLTIVWGFFAMSDPAWRWAAPVFLIAWAGFIWTGYGRKSEADTKEGEG